MSSNPFWDQQQELIKNWNEAVSKMPGMQMYENMFKNMMPNASQYWDQMTEAMKNPSDMWTNYTKQMSNMWDLYSKQMSTMAENMQKMANIIPNNMNSFAKMFPMMPNMANANGSADENNNTMFKFPYQIPGMENFQKMMEMWKDLGDPQKFAQEFQQNYMDLMQNMMKAFMPAGTEQYFQKPKELMDTIVKFYQEILSPWTQIDNTIMQRLAMGDYSAYADFFEQLEDKYEESFEKVFNMMGMGMNREANEDYMHMFNAYNKMIISGCKMMALVIDTFQKSMKTLVETYQKNLSEGKVVTTFREFYNLWYEVNEKALEDLFATDKFSKAFGEYSDYAGKYMIAQNKVMERMLSNLPIPTNTDMKSVYKNVYDLRKDVRDLKKEVEELKEAAAAAKTSTTAAK